MYHGCWVSDHLSRQNSDTVFYIPIHSTAVGTPDVIITILIQFIKTNDSPP